MTGKFYPNLLQIYSGIQDMIHDCISSLYGFVADSTLCKGQLLTNELRRNLFSLLSSWCSKSGTSPPVEKYVLYFLNR